MTNFEFSRSVSIGQYIARPSYLHRLTPATKYLIFLVTVSLAMGGGAFGLVLDLLLILALVLASRIPFSFLARGILPALPFLGLAALMQFVFAWPGDGSPVLFRFWFMTLTMRELSAAGLLFLRAIPLFLAASLFTSMTPESEISHGIEDILEPLGFIGIKPRRIALAVTASFRFVPIVAGEIESILRAQSCRGADFSARRRGVLARARAWLPLFVPVIVGSLEKAQALALAMEARGYRESGRSRYRDYPRRRGEIAFRILLVGVTAAGFVVDRLFIH